MIHDPKLLIRLIIRMIVRKLKLKHAAMILYEPEFDNYVLSISRGEKGYRIPQGFTRFQKDSPIIKLFTLREFHPVTFSRNAIVSEDINRLIWREGVINNNGNSTKEILQKVDAQMRMLNCCVCVPAYYHHKLMAILLLGEKDDSTRFEQSELDFFSALASDASMAIRNAQLFESLKKEAERNHQLFLRTVLVLGSTIEAKDSYTRGHTERVTQYALAIARYMADHNLFTFSKSFFDNLYIAGMLHDIGKIGVPESILNKIGCLTEEEYKIMKTHTAKGVEIVEPLGLPQEVLDGIKSHHETYTGSGYPENLKGDQIPVIAAILSVADAFDAMTTDRPYRKGLTKEEAMDEVRKNIGCQFNPLPAKVLIELCERGVI